MSDMKLMMQIGAVLNSSFGAAFASAKTTMSKLDNQTAQLAAKQTRIGGLMARSMMRPHASLGKLHAQYERVGRAIERNRNAQERLNRSVERGARLKGMQSTAGGNAASSATQFAAFALPVGGAIKQAVDFESAMAEVNKTVKFTAGNSLPKLGEELKQLSLQIPLTASELAQIAASGGQLGVADKDITSFTETVAKMGVAFDMPAEQAGESMAKLSQVLKIPINEIGKIGDMINEVSNNSPAKASEIVNAVSRVGSAMKTAKLSDEFGVSLTGSLIAQGRDASIASSAVESMLTTFSTLHLATKKQRNAFKDMGLDADQFFSDFKQNGESATLAFFDAIQKLPESERLGTVSTILGRNYGGDILSAANNTQQLNKNMSLLGKNSQGVGKHIGSMGKEFDAISSTSGNKIKLFKNNVSVLAITVGNALLPALNSTLTAVTPMVQKFANWAQKNPELVKNTVMLVGGLLLAKTAFWGVGFAVMSVVRPVMTVVTLFHRVRAGVAMLRGLSVLGRLAPLARRFGGAVGFIGRAFSALRVVIMANPIGLAVTLLVGAAVLIYRNWGKIKPFFQNLWNRLKAFANSGVKNILLTLAKFTPLGIFVRAWTAVFAYFRGLSAKFRQYGAHIVQGLINGITAKIGRVKAKISELGSMVSGAFKRTLGIQSPSRVFMGFGHNIAEGVAIGIGQQAPRAFKASDDMAKRLAQTEYSNKVMGDRSATRFAGTGSITFSPTIIVKASADAGDVQGQVQQGLSLSYAEFERMLERVEGDRSRRAFA